MTSKREDLFDALRHLEELEAAEFEANTAYDDCDPKPVTVQDRVSRQRALRNGRACNAATRAVRKLVIATFVRHFVELGIDPKEWEE